MFVPSNTIRGLLNSVNDLVDPQLHKGIYQIPCSCGQTYIVETRRSIKIRVKEHSVDILHNRVRTLALAEHSSKTKHHICMEDTKVLDKVKHILKR